ncbi:MAG: hydrogenase [Acidobacteriota bacterium]|nr:hydrogenase [Acidobacteriota bacterium]
MVTSDARLRETHRLLQLGILLFLLALLVGLAVPRFAVPRLALSVHLLGLMQGLFLSVLGLLWPRLKFPPKLSGIAFWLAVYGCFAAWTANLLGAIWGAGNTIVPIAAGQARGSDLQEAIIVIGLRTAGLALIVTAILVLWGLRASGNTDGDANGT